MELQQTLGISTIALIRPSHGAQLRMMYACSSVQPKWLRQLIASVHASAWETLAST